MTDRPDIRVVTRCHGGDLFYDLPTAPSRPYDPYVARRVDRVVPVSEIGSSHLVAHGFACDKLVVHRLGVNIPARVAPSASGAAWRLVSCSSMIPIKRVTLLAEALSMLRQSFIWTHFGDGVQWNDVRDIVASFPENGEARLVGRVTNKEVRRFYEMGTADLFINVSESEGVPVSVMEALSAGIPCVVTDAGGTSELVDDTVGKVLAKNVSAASIARAIEQELCDSAAHSAKRVAARRRAEEMCDANVNYNAFLLFLRSL
ncbi:MAG: glycosyltransferase [Candidatus Omnitrophota bacterium]